VEQMLAPEEIKEKSLFCRIGLNCLGLEYSAEFCKDTSCLVGFHNSRISW